MKAPQVTTAFKMELSPIPWGHAPCRSSVAKATNLEILDLAIHSLTGALGGKGGD